MEFSMHREKVNHSYLIYTRTLLYAFKNIHINICCMWFLNTGSCQALRNPSLALYFNSGQHPIHKRVVISNEKLRTKLLQAANYEEGIKEKMDIQCCVMTLNTVVDIRILQSN
ncbi:unnamed protein product [Rhizophagus irregularis]|nr:unnamed protein product [Rhizophagus irregularis]